MQQTYDFLKQFFFVSGCRNRHLLFDFAVEEVEPAGWKVDAITYDLHNDEIMVQGNIMTEYEERFMNLGKNINYIKFRNPKKA